MLYISLSYAVRISEPFLSLKMQGNLRLGTGTKQNPEQMGLGELRLEGTCIL